MKNKTKTKMICMLLTFKFLEHVVHRNFDQQQHNVLFLALKYEMNSNIIFSFLFVILQTRRQTPIAATTSTQLHQPHPSQQHATHSTYLSFLFFLFFQKKKKKKT
jgi:hypothetical protein